MTDYYLITLEEIGEIIDITEDSMIAEYKDRMVELARRRIELINKIKERKYNEPKYKEEECVLKWVPNPEDFRYPDEEPPDYEDCPCWSSPADPEGTTGTCEGDWGDCKLWYWSCGDRSYTECDRFAKECSKCDEILCKFRKVKQ
jgi:hypothetical protein